MGYIELIPLLNKHRADFEQFTEYFIMQNNLFVNIKEEFVNDTDLYTQVENQLIQCEMFQFYLNNDYIN